MEKEFVPYDIALAIKELGFDEPCFGFYSLHEKNKAVGGNYPCDGTNSAPLYQQAFRWFREELKDSALEPYDIVKHHSYNMKVSWEEAQDTCLRKLIEIVKERRDDNTLVGMFT